MPMGLAGALDEVMLAEGELSSADVPRPVALGVIAMAVAALPTNDKVPMPFETFADDPMPVFSVSGVAPLRLPICSLVTLRFHKPDEFTTSTASGPICS